MIIYNPDPTFDEAIKFARGLGPHTENGVLTNPEYTRGQVELIIDLFAVEDGMDRKDEIEARITE